MIAPSSTRPRGSHASYFGQALYLGRSGAEGFRLRQHGPTVTTARSRGRAAARRGHRPGRRPRAGSRSRVDGVNAKPASSTVPTGPVREGALDRTGHLVGGAPRLRASSSQPAIAWAAASSPRSAGSSSSVRRCSSPGSGRRRPALLAAHRRSRSCSSCRLAADVAGRRSDVTDPGDERGTGQILRGALRGCGATIRSPCSASGSSTSRCRSPPRSSRSVILRVPLIDGLIDLAGERSGIAALFAIFVGGIGNLLAFTFVSSMVATTIDRPWANDGRPCSAMRGHPGSLRRLVGAVARSAVDRDRPAGLRGRHPVGDSSARALPDDSPGDRARRPSPRSARPQQRSRPRSLVVDRRDHRHRPGRRSPRGHRDRTDHPAHGDVDPAVAVQRAQLGDLRRPRAGRRRGDGLRVRHARARQPDQRRRRSPVGTPSPERSATTS